MSFCECVSGVPAAKENDRFERRVSTRDGLLVTREPFSEEEGRERERGENRVLASPHAKGKGSFFFRYARLQLSLLSIEWG